MGADYLGNTERANVLRACRVLHEAKEWLECILEDVEAGNELNDEAFKGSWRHVAAEADKALNALGYDRDMGN